MRLRPPAEVRARVPGERVLAWAPSGRSSVVATETALLLPEVDGVATRVPWDLVVRASWVEGALELVAQEVPGGPPVTSRIGYDEDPGSLPEVVRERVNASIVVQRRVDLVGERGIRVLARRQPGSTELRWSVVFDAGLDPRDPELRRRADEALAELRVSLGV
ncbi:MAG: hypothetical protein GC157_13935 [Frankiales bacterium]|nr:hypothetical protein [Frankiales bacterium]